MRKLNGNHCSPVFWCRPLWLTTQWIKYVLFRSTHSHSVVSVLCSNKLNGNDNYVLFFLNLYCCGRYLRRFIYLSRIWIMCRYKFMRTHRRSLHSHTYTNTIYVNIVIQECHQLFTQTTCSTKRIYSAALISTRM